MQYLEAPPVMVGDPQTLVAKPGDTTGANTGNGPRVEFIYQVAGPQMAMTDPPQGTITNRQCTIRRLTLDQASQVSQGATLVLPTLGAWSRILNPITQLTGPGVDSDPLVDLSVNLDVFPDALLGAGTSFRTYHFGVYGPPVPLIGEPTVQLPQKIAIDMAVSNLPNRGTPGLSYDIMFAPSGQMITSYGASGSTGATLSAGVSGNTAVFLWVRDISKVQNMQPTSFSPWTFDPAQQQFLRGGEQQIVGIRNGFIGTAPVLWPDATGNYTTNPLTDPYTMARQRLD
jgi:hypothetical protein